MSTRHVLVLGDQLNRTVGPLVETSPADTIVLMIESAGLARAMPHHKQKLVLVFSAMRHFAAELEAADYTVAYHRADSFAGGIEAHLADHPGATIEVMTPSDWGVEERLRSAAEQAGGRLKVLPNELWLTTEREFDAWAEGRKSLRLEYFYRSVRKQRGWLMEGSEPAGGQWNYDADNRQTPEPGHSFPEPIRFEPDSLTRAVMEEVEATYPNHFGSVDGFNWPVTRADALDAFETFLDTRLARFGPYEDAMVEGEPVLYHSLLSAAINLGLLHPAEVCEGALDFATDPRNGIPLQSIEGFIRQILGWREFMHHIYRRQMPQLRAANGLGHEGELPDLYWGGDTRMRCLGETIKQLQATGHNHHIQRLMVLGNFALIARVDPRQLNDWFLTCYVDALDWVVTPNVMGMSQYADLGSFTSKPYAASGKYIQRMSDHCARCAYDVRETIGDGACPLNSLYWAFMDHHSERLSANPRMGLILGSWARRNEATRREILEQVARVRSRLRDGTL